MTAASRRRLGLLHAGADECARIQVSELEQLGKFEDAVLAARFGRTEQAVRVMRTKHGILTAREHRRQRISCVLGPHIRGARANQFW